MIKLVNILESITEKQVTKGDWDKADGEQRVDWLLQIFDDADKAEKHFETEWEDLPNEARDFMKISESVNEGPPSWYTSFEKQLADKLDVEVRDLRMNQVDPHLIEVGADFSQQGLDNFPSAVNSLLRTDEFKGKMVFVKNEKTEDKIVEKHPELEDYIYNDESFWVYIKPVKSSVKESVNEGFEIGDIVKFSYTGINKSPKSRMEIIDSRKMFASDLMAYIVKKEDGSTAEYDQTQLTAAPTMWRPNKSDLNEGSSPGYSKFIFSLQTLIGDIAPNAWEDKSQIDSTSMKRIHNSLKKRYGDDYAKFNDLLKTQKGQFGNWYLKESVNEGKWMDLWDESQDKAPSAWTKHQKWIVANAERYGFDPDKVKKLLKQHTAIHNRTYGWFTSVEDWMEEKLKSRRTS